jgi:ribonuclease P protein component
MLPYDNFPAMEYTLPKSERLHAEKSIKELFEKGSSFFLYPFKVMVLAAGDTEGGVNQALFSVSKKKIKRATGRNFIKRRMKESYRLNKALLAPAGISLGFIFIGDPSMTFGAMEPKMKLALEKVQLEVAKNQADNDAKN